MSSNLQRQILPLKKDGGPAMAGPSLPVIPAEVPDGPC